MSVAVRPALRRRERRLFRDLPARLHAGAPAFIPMLDAAFARLHDRSGNPFWRTAEGCEWIAWRGSEPVGRVGACRDGELEKCEPGCGTVGFFDCIEDPEAAAALFETAFAWLRERGCSRARGPLSYTIHDTAGLLVDGFDTPPAIDTTWNPPSHVGLWEASGWRGAQDLVGVCGAIPAEAPERARRFAARARSRGVTVRPLDFSRFDEEVERVRRVYNTAWADNWGHVPIPGDDFAYRARDLKAVIDHDIVRVAEREGEPVGLLLGLPDLNVAVRASRGRLLPFGWWRLLRARRTTHRARVILLGTVPGHRIRGVEALLLEDGFRASAGRYTWCEASWVLADNAAMLNGLALYGLDRVYKRWRVYERTLGS